MGKEHERDLDLALRTLARAETVARAILDERLGLNATGHCHACGEELRLEGLDVCHECLARQHGENGPRYWEFTDEDHVDRWVDELRHDYQLRAGGW